MRTLTSLRNCINNYHNINPLTGNSSLYKLNTFLDDYYINNNMDWKKYLKFNRFGYCKINIDIIDNIELSIINLPQYTNFYNTNNGNSSLLLLNGEMKKYYINNDFIIPTNVNIGDVFNIYDGETYALLPSKNSLLLDITLKNYF